MRCYHRTTQAAAEAILATGFRDATDTYMTSREHTGVWLSDQPLDENEGASGRYLLGVDIPEALAPRMSEWEWVEELKGFREWLVPAAWINANAQVSVVEIEEELPAWMWERILDAPPKRGRGK